MKKWFSFFIWFLVSLVFITASMDIFLVFRLGGFNIRIAVLAMLLFIGIWLMYVFYTKRIYLLPGMGWLVVFALVNTFFSLGSALFVRSFSYAIWFWIFSVWVVALVHMTNEVSVKKETGFSYEKLLLVYILSFLPALVIGWLQWVFPSLTWMQEGLWRMQGRLALFGGYGLYRVNGWSYEPSYYATYLAVLFPLLWVWFRQSRGIVRLSAGMYLGFALMMMVLSTSRMGWLALIGEIIVLLCGEILFFLSRRYSKNFLRKLVLGMMIVAGIGVVGGFVLFPWQRILEKNLSHSYLERMERLQDTLEVFFRQPFISVSLGGVAADIALFRANVVPQNNHDVKAFEAMSVPLEILGGMGVAGVFIVSGFVASLMLVAFSRWRKLSENGRWWLFALFLGLCSHVFLLLFNQNILRVYVWNHLALVFGFLAWSERDNRELRLVLPEQWMRGLASVLAGVLVASLCVLMFVFQPLRIEVKGARIKANLFSLPEGGAVYYNTGRGFYGFESLPLSIGKDFLTFSFASNAMISKRFFDLKDSQLVWRGFRNLQTNTNWKGYVAFGFQKVYQALMAKDQSFTRSAEKLVQGLNLLLEDDTFWQSVEKHVYFSPLTRTYKQKKEKKEPDFDPIRYHRLLLEDFCVWVPRNPEDHNVREWLVELWFPHEKEKIDMNDFVSFENIELDTTLGKVTLPFSSFSTLRSRVAKEEKKVYINSFFSWSNNRRYIQARLFYRWWTVVVVIAAVLTSIGVWFWAKRYNKE